MQSALAHVAPKLSSAALASLFVFVFTRQTAVFLMAPYLTKREYRRKTVGFLIVDLLFKKIGSRGFTRFFQQTQANMDWRKINFAMDYLASTGTVFSVEQRVAIQAALTVLQQENQFKHVHFIGKILGTENDYWIVCGIGNDYLKDRTYFYSINHGIDWVMLPKLGDDTMELGLACRGHFVGDPTADSETDICPETADEMNDGDDWVTIKEEERLSATVLSIMNECAVVPRGALIKNANGLVFENRMFEGLSKLEASQFHSFYHVRRPENPWDRNIVIRADYNLSLDFLDSIACDLPIGCWSIQIDRLETTTIIRSLYWPGFVGFHQLNTQNFGWIYVGTGKKNWDVPFMVLPLPYSAKISVVEGGDYQYEEIKGEDGDADMMYPGINNE